MSSIESSSVLPLISAFVGGLFSGLLSPWLTSHFNERSRKIELYKTVYPEKFKAAREVMKQMSALYKAVITTRTSVGKDMLLEQSQDFLLMANSYDWLLGDLYQQRTYSFYKICSQILNEKDERNIEELEAQLYKAGNEFSAAVRNEVHLPHFEGLYPPPK